MENYKLIRLDTDYPKAYQRIRELKDAIKVLETKTDERSQMNLQACQKDLALYEDAVNHDPNKIDLYWYPGAEQATLFFIPPKVEKETRERLPKKKIDVDYHQQSIDKLLNDNELNPYTSVRDCLNLIIEQDKRIEFLRRCITAARNLIEEKRDPYLNKYYGTIMKTARRCLQEEDSDQLRLF